MNRNNAIVIVDDDEDDTYLLVDAIKKFGVKNEFKCFNNGIKALLYLRSTKEDPALIISDINMPLMDGIMFKNKIDEDSELNKRKFPFVFFSTTIDNLNHVADHPLAASIKKPGDAKDYQPIVKKMLHLGHIISEA